MRRSELVLLLITPAFGCAHPGPAMAPEAPETKLLETSLFEGVAPLEVTFLVDFQGADEDETLIAKWRDGEIDLPARLVIQRPEGAESIRVLARTSGNLSRQFCRYPKLALELDPEIENREEVQRRFGDRFFLVRHCNDDEDVAGALPGANNARRDYFSYKLQELVGLPSLRTRQVWAHYEDVRTKKQGNTRFGYFLENAFTAAEQRLGGKEKITPPGDIEAGSLSYRDLDGPTLARTLLFEVLINNRDFEIIDFRPLPRCLLEARHPVLHNAFLFEAGAAGRLPLVFDFDLSTFAGLPSGILPIVGDDREFLTQIGEEAALPGDDPLTKWMVLRLQHLRRYLTDRDLQLALADFRGREKSIRAWLAGLDLDEKSKTAMRAHIDAFFTAIRPENFHLPRTATATPLMDRVGGKAQCELPPTATLAITSDKGDWLEVRLVEKEIAKAGVLEEVCRGLSSRTGWVASSAVERTAPSAP